MSLFNQPSVAHFGLRWQAKRDTAFARAGSYFNLKSPHPRQSAVAAALCRRSPKTIRHSSF
jgi:hypothetical protein